MTANDYGLKGKAELITTAWWLNFIDFIFYRIFLSLSHGKFPTLNEKVSIL